MLALLALVTLTADTYGIPPGKAVKAEVGQRVTLLAPNVATCAADAGARIFDADHVEWSAERTGRSTLTCTDDAGRRLGWPTVVVPDLERRVMLEPNEAAVLELPDIQRLSPRLWCFDAMTVSSRHIVLAAGDSQCQSSLLVWDADGRLFTVVVEVMAQRWPDEPDLTRLRYPEDRLLSAAGIVSAVSADPKVVKAEMVDGGVRVTSVGAGATHVRVKTRAGPIVHRFVVRYTAYGPMPDLSASSRGP